MTPKNHPAMARPKRSEHMNFFRPAICLSLCAALLPISHAPHAAPTSEPGEHNDKPGDYAWRMPLQVSGKQGVVALRLPREVYLNAQSAELSDLRLFDANGNKMAFALHTPALQSHLQRNITSATVFPLLADAPPAGGELELDIRTGANGNLISVKSKTPSGAQVGLQPGKPAKLQSLIMDLQAALQDEGKPMIEALRFTLPAAAGTGAASLSNYSAQVWLEASDDLQHWEAVGTAELDWLQNAGQQTLANDRLEFEPRRFRYARLSWRRGEPLEFAKVDVHSVTQHAQAPQLETLELTARPGKIRLELLYSAAIAIPVESLALRFEQANVVYPARIGAYQTFAPEKPGLPVTERFEQQLQATFYKITQNDKLRQSGSLTLPMTHNAEWVLRPQATTSDIKPTLVLGWQAASLVFVTSGQPPYTLAFGRAKAAAEAQPLEQVAPGFTLAELQKLEAVTAGATVRQNELAAGKPDAAEQQAQKSAQQRKWLLWGVLVLGVLVLAAMAMKLLGQMKQQ
jgi:hypothetical protein